MTRGLLWIPLLATVTGCGALGSLPESGVLLYHDPAPQGTMSKRRLKAPTIVFAIGDETIDEESLGGVEVRTGRLGWGQRDESAVEERLDEGDRAKKIEGIELQPSTPIFWLTPEEFVAVRDRFVELGLLDIPPQRDATPPQDQAFFLLDDGSDGRRIIPFPSPRRLLAAGYDAAEGQRIARAWAECVTLIFHLVGNR